MIGFRQRPYLTDLGISIPTQTKFYQGYIKEKGTKNAIDALGNATINNITSNLAIKEEWAFRVGWLNVGLLLQKIIRKVIICTIKK